MKSWDREFVKTDQITLFEIILAANYMNIKSLLDLTCQAAADMIKYKSPEDLRHHQRFLTRGGSSKERKPVGLSNE
ncbi:hypothetical protein GIB67_024945 [Kingdonia uniflora]|uniref:SKP1 component dimerisation domain-containing protein n=1 Tax=Kingdonia uniflora TaxID=39325 RepID=A0A7J7NZ23_9MAGN|nr:hypothetical protein GIB67_024945 [Kingdonia uniflora]